MNYSERTVALAQTLDMTLDMTLAIRRAQCAA